jgi:hypothetical protein
LEDRHSVRQLARLDWQMAPEALPMCGQPDIGREHEPKCVIAYKWNIDEYGNESKKRNNERNDVHAENIENPNSGNTHIAILPKASRE